jgi:hypothetical protein
MGSFLRPMCIGGGGGSSLVTMSVSSVLIKSPVV